MIDYYIIKVIAEPLTTTIALALSGFSAGVSILLLIDFFKRHCHNKNNKTALIQEIDSELGPIDLETDETRNINNVIAGPPLSLAAPTPTPDKCNKESKKITKNKKKPKKVIK
jgi:hypothetical protein